MIPISGHLLSVIFYILSFIFLRIPTSGHLLSFAFYLIFFAFFLLSGFFLGIPTSSYLLSSKQCFHDFIEIISIIIADDDDVRDDNDNKKIVKLMSILISDAYDDTDTAADDI